ncbi:nucleotidyltransferase domain-containing protein [Nocardioides aurantiacus]|uniref:nucleotidyltransferase domain-containing protein n=1 Tax=Nocardioides aurantiacus TaxID=86796 RepID=UPI00403F5D61
MAPGLTPGGPTSWHYGPPVTGRLGERLVRCASAADQLAMHEGYAPRATDRADVRLLATRFDLPIPDWAR